MSGVRGTLHVSVEYLTGTEEGDEDVGHPYYVASCKEIVAITDAETWDELLHNIREMISASLEGEDVIAIYNLSPNPRIEIMDR